MTYRLPAIVLSLAALSAAACSPPADTNPDSGSDAAVSTPDAPTDDAATDAPANIGAGTCADPYHLDVGAMRSGNDMIFEGTTAGARNDLHPYGAGDLQDAEEAVLEFRVPDNMPNARLTTEGSDFDTVLYVREACSQIANGADLAFADDTQVAGNEMLQTYSTAYLTGLVPGSVLFVIVDGKTGGDAASSGRFRLTISPFTPGASGYPCATDASGASICNDTVERCSTANICTRVVATGTACDPSGLSNTCASGATCVSDPSPVEGDTGSVCAAPGTHAGAPCRTSGTPCDAPLVCNDQMDAAMCVRVIAADGACDPAGVTNRCATGLHCRTVAGTSFCEASTM